MATRDINSAAMSGVGDLEGSLRPIGPTPGVQALYDIEQQLMDDPEGAALRLRDCYAPQAKVVVGLLALASGERQRLLARLAMVPGMRSNITSLERMVRDELKDRGDDVARKARTRADRYTDLHLWDDAPTLVVPDGYTQEAGGIARETGEDRATLVCPRVMVPSAIYQDPHDRRQYVEVKWEKPLGGWESRVLSQLDIADSRRIVAALADAGAPVTSTNAREVVAWLAAVMERNASEIPHRLGCRRMGWVSGDFRDGFLWGERHIGGGGNGVLVGVSEHAQIVARSYREGGTLAGWLDHVWRVVRQHPRAAIAVYASAAAPLLAVLPDASSLAFEYGAGSRTGKGIALEAALSVWAHPEQAMGRWDSTAKGIGLRGALHPSMPLVMEDTKLADRNGQLDTGKISEVVYGYTNTGLRMKTGEDGKLACIEPVRGVLLTAGEQAYADAAGDSQGAVARTYSIRCSPWRSVDTETRRHVDRVRQGAAMHFGHAGPAIVRHLLACSDAQIEGYRREYRKRREEVALGEQGTAQAAAGHMALLWTASVVLADAVQGCDQPATLWDELYRHALASSEGADVPTRALLDVLGEIAARPELRAVQGAQSPPGGFGVRVRTDAYELRVSWLSQTLERLGYQPANIRNGWVERGWCSASAPACRWPQGVVRAIVLDPAALPPGVDLDVQP